MYIGSHDKQRHRFTIKMSQEINNKHVVRDEHWFGLETWATTVYTSMWQVSSGLKEDEMGSQGPQCHGGVKNSIFESFRFPAPKLALVPGSR